MKKKKFIYLSVIILAAIILGGWYMLGSKKEAKATLETAVISKGTITNYVTATGTIEPVDKVEVGTQVSGVINSIHVDFNDNVKKGQLLAELDRSTLEARLTQARANLEVAKNDLDFQQINYDRMKELYEKESVSQAEFNNAEFQLKSARASFSRTNSELEQAQVNLSYATIYSPLDGTILSRAVEEGQTVSASTSAPTLFTIARDLNKMQVVASVDEADIGQVKKGQKATFTVDAYPEDEFSGIVDEIRLEPIVTSNVVTYSVIIEAPNPDLKLLPGLTATVSIVSREEKDVVVADLRALRFTPTEDVMTMFGGGEIPAQERRKPGTGTVWIQGETGIHPVEISTGASDGSKIMIKGGLNEGDKIITGVKYNQELGEGKRTQSPFMRRR